MASIFDKLSSFAATAEKPSLEPTYLETGLYRATISDIEIVKTKDQTKDMVVFEMKLAEDGVKSSPDSKGKIREVKRGEFTFRHRVIITEADNITQEQIARNMFEVWASINKDEEGEFRKMAKILGEGFEAFAAALMSKTVYLKYTYDKGKTQYAVDVKVLTKNAWENLRLQAQSA